MHNTSPRLIALDWGTSALRAWLLADDARIVDARQRGSGLLNVTAGADAQTPARDYATAFADICADWLQAYPGLPAIACGMVGSAQGWREAGYLTVPTALVIDAQSMTAVPHERGILHLIPGLRVEHDGTGNPADVMRGEETQLIGIMEMLDQPAGEQLIVLPGTHTKWVKISDRQVISFSTAMTGELYGLLMHHGILARTATAGTADADAAFARGLDADRSRGLSSALFGARALVLEDQLEAAALADYVSGLLIADEVAHLLPENLGEQRIILCGNPALCRRYESALARHNVRPAASVTEEAAARGLWTVAVDAGLLSPADPNAQRIEEVS
ncbi:2-keto-3-deoxy-galactonokinase [Mycolicibacterium wolinskyi]|uniref:2-keto-3-deoxy-galactonokinase n=1 Tax=Mycolicibacterium wolinskyi TaxID=59750 RepID=A0A132PLP1_9MYCO|nr:2-dehydro-3-deoxygalactonokinase [Mycolicibacterium wolinskyi]KWX23259.1 2-keto-3-deoxy-galactonokinase [Mycolicibacterium wolinskyi]